MCPGSAGWCAWGAASEELERRLAEQESPAITLHVDSWVRRGRDYLQVVIAARVDAADVADALDLAGRLSGRRQAMMLPGGTWPEPRPRSARQCMSWLTGATPQVAKPLFWTCKLTDPAERQGTDGDKAACPRPSLTICVTGGLPRL